MTKEEFLQKYCWAPESAADCHQITWDLLEDMQMSLEGAYDGVDTETAVGAAMYEVDVLLEVIDRGTPDYVFLTVLRSDLEDLQ